MSAHAVIIFCTNPVGQKFRQLPNFFQIFKTSVTIVANPKFGKIYQSSDKWGFNKDLIFFDKIR